MSIRKVSIIFSHWNTWRWTALAVHFLKKYQWPLDHEILVANNSVDHPSIKCLTETPLGEGVKIIQGEKDFPSHGRGNELCLREATGSHIFLSESDAFPIQDNWANAYIKLVGEGYDLIGPEIPQGSGRYIHPAGSLYNRAVFDRMSEWRESIKDWVFCPDAGIELRNSSRPYHVVIHRDELEARRPSDSLRERVRLWQRCENLQEMRCFSSDTFEDYMTRTGITEWTPPHNKHIAINKIGYEAGQVAAYFAQSHGFRCLAAPTHIQWMAGFEGRQAAYSDVLGGFRHCWCGTSSFCEGIAPEVRAFKMSQMDLYWLQLPEDIRAAVEKLEREYA